MLFAVKRSSCRASTRCLLHSWSRPLTAAAARTQWLTHHTQISDEGIGRVLAVYPGRGREDTRGAAHEEETVRSGWPESIRSTYSPLDTVAVLIFPYHTAGLPCMRRSTRLQGSVSGRDLDGERECVCLVCVKPISWAWRWRGINRANSLWE